MNLKPNTIITSIRTCGLVAALTGIMLALTPPVLAHGGFEHVTGTVVKASGNVLTVKTAKGNVDVKLDSKTELTRDGHQAQIVDLKTGVRVVVDVPEGSKDRIAHSVKIGVTATPGHDAHK